MTHLSGTNNTVDFNPEYYSTEHVRSYYKSRKRFSDYEFITCVISGHCQVTNSSSKCDWEFSASLQS